MRILIVIGLVLSFLPLRAQTDSLSKFEAWDVKLHLRRNPYVIHNCACCSPDNERLLYIKSSKIIKHPDVPGKFQIKTKALPIATYEINSTDSLSGITPIIDAEVETYIIDMYHTFAYDRDTYWLYSLLNLTNYQIIDGGPCLGPLMYLNPEKSLNPNPHEWNKKYLKWIKRHIKRVQKVAPHRHI